jgi:hypothetical protein
MALIDCEYHEVPQIQARINQLMKEKEKLTPQVFKLRH